MRSKDVKVIQLPVPKDSSIPQPNLGKHSQLKDPIESIKIAAQRIYDLLRGVSPLQNNSHISLVFALLFYKRISDTCLIDMPQGHAWKDVSTGRNPAKLTVVLDNLRRILGSHNDEREKQFFALNALDIYDAYWEIKPATQRSIFQVIDELDLSFRNFDLFEFDTALSKVFADALNNDRRHVGEYSTPAWLEELLFKILDPKSQEISYFPFCRTGTIISAFIKAYEPSGVTNIVRTNPSLNLNIQGMEQNQLMWAFTKLRLSLLGGISIDIANANPFDSQPKLPSDVICCIPPFNYSQDKSPATSFIGKEEVEIPRGKSSIWFMLNALQHTSKAGRVACVLPAGYLFDHAHRKIRRILLEENYLDAVVELPDGSFLPSTHIKTVLLVLNKSKQYERKHSVAFGKFPNIANKRELTSVDIDTFLAEYSSNSPSANWVFANMEDIQRKDYNLIPSYFHEGLEDELDVLLLNKNGKRLEEICHVIRGRARRPIEDHAGLPLISTKDLSGEVTDPYLDFSYVTLSKPESSNHIITQKCILVSLVGRAAKATIFDPQRAYKSGDNEDIFDGILINHNLVCLVPDENIVDFEYLYYQLNSPLFHKQFDRLHRNIGIPNISLSDFRSIIIPVLDRKDQQKEITRQTKEALLIEANAKLEALKANLNVEEEKQEAEFQIVSHLAHNLSPRLNSVTSTLKHLYDFLESQELLLKPLQELYYEGQVTELVGDAISKARNDVTQMVNLIRDTKKVITEEINDDDFKSIKLADFLIKIDSKYRGRSFSLDIKCDKNIIFKLHEASFTEMIDNFIRNAETHGFNDQNHPHQMRISAYPEQNNLIIDFMNNGLPLPAELTVEKFKSFGGRRNNSPGEGLGGAYIDKVIRQHSGSLQIIRTDSQYSTCFRMIFPLRDNYE